MKHILNACYLVAIVALVPWLLFKALTTGKYRQGLWRKFWGLSLIRDDDAPCAWFHGVSVGEIHLLRYVVRQFQDRFPEWTCIISTTTDTGYAEACRDFPESHVFFWPLDFTWAVRRALRRVNPSLIVLAESEIWPNFLAAAQDRGTPVVLVNGRMSPRTLRRYRTLRGLSRKALNQIELFLVQSAEYAAGFRELGVAPDKIAVTGSVKYDGAVSDRNNPRTQTLRALFAVGAADLIWIAGSTQDPEERISLELFEKFRERHPTLRLFLVPRQKERFDEVARLIARTGLPVVRRSALTEPLSGPSPVVLVDSIGELGALWGLADVAFVGGSLDGKRGGQNMIEPAAYGAAVLFGPHVWNFKETAARLLEGRAALQVADREQLEADVARLLCQPEERRRMGEEAKRFVAAQQGATERTIDLVGRLIREARSSQRAA